MIKKRSRPQGRVRERSPEPDQDTVPDETVIPISELLELRQLKKARQGIDANKLKDGVKKKKRRREEEEGDAGGLKPGANVGAEGDEEDEDDLEAKARKAIRSNNFTQQTNALDVDKHMMAYIEENLKVRSRPRDDSDPKNKKPADPQEELYNIAEKWNVHKQKPTTDNEGSVTNSMKMLTAIPEVDLGMDSRLKNIEDTEKAKRAAAEERQGRSNTNNDEVHLVTSRFYRPNLKMKSDTDIIRDAKLEAMGLHPQDREQRSNNDRPQLATDEAAVERFKKRMRK